ncbi:LPXTG cell wall anchor domain-containing protein [Carnobacteriaceae bacterium zg-ZUI78]|nr:LPXTG cell wall anchor domain-containing protein [Carnobacteriaceae bacterium zg-ZUI78]
MTKLLNKISSSAIALATIIGVTSQVKNVQAEEVGPVNDLASTEVSEKRTIEISKSDVDDAKKNEDIAEQDVAKKEATLKEAARDEDEKQKAVDEATRAKTLAEDKAKALPEIEKTIQDETAKRDEAQNALPHAQQEVTEKNQDKDTKEVAVSNAQRDKENAQKDVDALRAQSSSEVDALNDQIKEKEAQKVNAQGIRDNIQRDLDAVNTEIADKERAIRDYTPTQKELKQTNPADDAQERKRLEFMEDVEYHGQPVTETIVIDEHAEYTPNIDKIMEHVADYINELKRINNLPGHVTVSTNPEHRKFADYHAKELVKTFSHASNYPGGKPNSAENILDMPMDKRFMSDKEFAYRILLNWFSEYNNVHPNYGHAITLLEADGDFILGIAAKPDQYPGIQTWTSYTATFNVFKLNRHKVLTQYGTPETGMFLRIDRNENAYHSEDFKPTENAKQVFFVPNTTFRYVTNVSEGAGKQALQDELTSLQARRTTLSNQLAGQNSIVTDFEEAITRLEADKQEAINNDTAHQTALTAAQARLTQATTALDNAKQALAQATKDAHDAQKRVSDLENTIKAANSALAKAQSDKQAATSDPQALEEAIVNAQTALDNAKAAKAQAAKDVALAKATFNAVHDAYTYVKRLYDLQESIKLVQTNNGIHGVPKETPRVDALPTLDVNDIVSVPKDYPTVNPLPTISVDEVERLTKQVTHLPQDYPTVNPLPTISVEEVERLTKELEKQNDVVKPIRPIDVHHKFKIKSEIEPKLENTNKLTLENSADTSQNMKKLPHTGTSDAHTLFAGVLSLFGAGVVVRRRKEK